MQLLLQLALQTDRQTDSTTTVTLCACVLRVNKEFHYPTRRPATFDPMSGLKVILELRKFPWSFFGASNCR